LFHQLNVNIVAFAYRGYSSSNGTPSEDGIKKDAHAIVDFVKNEPMIDKDKMFLIGRSLGGAVAIYTASQYKQLFRGVIVENTFTSMGDMVDKIFFFLRYFKFLILRNYWQSIDLVKDIQSPMLFITGDQDELVPMQMTLELHK
jgi:fermentation-respiration switch protein FrsA (DUF1100 family)